MHLPVYLDDKEILEKLEGWGVDPITKVKRRRYPGTDIEDGTRFLKEVLNKCECWMEGEEGGREEQVDGQVHEENNEEEGQTDEEQGEEGLQKKETEGETSNREEGEREKDNINNNEQTMEQDTQWTEMEISDSFNTFLGDMERDRQGSRDQNKGTDREEEIKMDNMVKDGGGNGQIRRALKVKPNLESVRKKIMTETNRFDVLRGLEEENDE
ncbi:hypothetical protein M9458_057674 [Cirrhinus mrigala]|uniref:Uncharacterized protein n=1 Tax=Cirrhinus mrigala TaxID=683832 RepID=A0ABD0MDY8_CIRMR